MLNKDINSRFEDWLLNPKESLDFEVKQWIDLDDVDGQGLVAKALIALENHGGGFLLFGYREDPEKKLVPDENRPKSLKPYLADSLNSILKRRAEPAFHVEVTLQAHPITGEEYPLVSVAGTSRVPVRSDSATPKSLKNYTYYIRAPGPESREPLNASEWDGLLRRVVLNQREEVISLLRAFLPSTVIHLESDVTEAQKLIAFEAESLSRWESLNAGLEQGHPAKIEGAFFYFSARLVGQRKVVKAEDVMRANDAARRYTGWPVFLTSHQDDNRPKMLNGVIEAWLAHSRLADAGHADFWRIDPSGQFFLLRGYQEDSLDPARGYGAAGTLFELTLPVWRLGEFLLRVVELGGIMCEGGFEILVSCHWTGLAGRKLFVHNMRRLLSGNYQSHQNAVSTTGQFSEQMVRELLPEVVSTLTEPLYNHFDFFSPPSSLYQEELERMTSNRM